MKKCKIRCCDDDVIKQLITALDDLDKEFLKNTSS